MYTPTPNQIAIYGLEKTQGRFYEKNEIFAGTFRANKWRDCKATLPGGVIYEGHIYVDREGACYICQVLIHQWIFVFIASADDMHQEQSKILDLTILPSEEIPETIIEKDGEFEERVIKTLEFDFPAGVYDRIMAFEEIGLGGTFRGAMRVILFMIRAAIFIMAILAFKYGHNIIGGLIVLLYGHVSFLAGVTMLALKILKK